MTKNKVIKTLMDKKVYCCKCKKKLGRTSLLELYKFDGEGILNYEKKEYQCKRCIDRGVRELQGELSFARFGEYDMYDQIDFDEDFPGFRG